MTTAVISDPYDGGKGRLTHVHSLCFFPPLAIRKVVAIYKEKDYRLDNCTEFALLHGASPYGGRSVASCGRHEFYTGRAARQAIACFSSGLLLEAGQSTPWA